MIVAAADQAICRGFEVRGRAWAHWSSFHGRDYPYPLSRLVIRSGGSWQLMDRASGADDLTCTCTPTTVTTMANCYYARALRSPVMVNVSGTGVNAIAPIEFVGSLSEYYGSRTFPYCS
jgi:hypothetical protein